VDGGLWRIREDALAVVLAFDEFVADGSSFHNARVGA
jgi:hypothetical protein